MREQMGLLNGSGMDRRFFHRFGASRLDRTICSSAGPAALAASQGIALGTEPEQFSRSKLILAWGQMCSARTCISGHSLWRRGGTAQSFTLSIPFATHRSYGRSSLAINPGSDLARALGMIHVIFRDGLQDRGYVRQNTEGSNDLYGLARHYPRQ
jgi:anaerobic selenocysteine-containing dehydrogenase